MTTSDPGQGPIQTVDGFDELLGTGVLIVTGKGGVGKTTTAAALALASVASGRRTLLVDVEGRQSFAHSFATAPWDYTERQFRPGLWGAALDPTDAVYEYLELFYGIRRIQWMMERSNALDFVTTAAPGLRDLLIVGKLYELEARRRDDGRRQYDLIVVDAPPTGRIVPFLQAPEAVTEIVRVGPIRRQAAQIKEMLTTARRVRTVLVTLLEEMPVRETIEAVAALRDAQVAVGPIVANQAVAPKLSDDELRRLDGLGASRIRSRAADAGARMSGRTADLLLETAHRHRARIDLQRRLQHELGTGCGLPVLRLPLLTGATFEAAELQLLADVLAIEVGEAGPHAHGSFTDTDLAALLEAGR